MTILVLASLYSNYVNSMLIDIQVSNMMNVDIIFQPEINRLRMKKNKNKNARKCIVNTSQSLGYNVQDYDTFIRLFVKSLHITLYNY